MEPEEFRQGECGKLADSQVIQPRGGISICRAVAAGGGSAD